jgi:hypothetical protein
VFWLLQAWYQAFKFSEYGDKNRLRDCVALDIEADRREPTTDIPANRLGVDPLACGKHTSIWYLLAQVHIRHQSNSEGVFEPSQSLSLLDHWLRESIASPRVDFFVDDFNKNGALSAA